VEHAALETVDLASALESAAEDDVPSGAERTNVRGVTRMATLYDRLGGLEAITAVVESFVARCAGDDRINRKFERTDIPRLKKMLVDQVCEATGGPCTYSGRDMKVTHADMGVTTGEFDALVEDLVATLEEFGVPNPEQEELLGLLGPMRDDVVETESPKTGLPLPDAYQPAPALS
jgi:hemoglobin